MVPLRDRQGPRYGRVEGDSVEEIEGTPWDEHTFTGSRFDARVGEAPGACRALDVLLRRHQLPRPRQPNGCDAQRGAGVPDAGRHRLSGEQRTHRPRRAHRHPARCLGRGAVRGRARRRVRQEGAQRPDRRGTGLRFRLDDRQRRQRARLAAQRPHLLAQQEHRHLQADGALDRHRPRPRRHAHRRPDQRPQPSRTSGPRT